MSIRYGLISVLISLSQPLLCQTMPGIIPSGTPLALKVDAHYPMRTGVPIRAHLLYPVYANNALILRKDTTITGSVFDLLPDRKRRVNAALGGDFTRFHIPKVRFDHIVLADGVTLPLAAGPATNGSPLYRATAPPPVKGSFLHREFDSGISALGSNVTVFTAPGKADRLLQFIYGRLPYHPERIEKGTSWTIETTSDLFVPAQPAVPTSSSVVPRKQHFWEQPIPAAGLSTRDNGAWIVQADLSQSLSSETSKSGEAIKAVLAEPIYDKDHTLAVPQGATLTGTVTRAKPARRFGRTGVLSFNFNQLTLPNAETQNVETQLTGVDSSAQVVLNSEGQAQSKPQDKLAVPLFLAALASRPLDQDCGHSGGCKGDTPGAGGVSGAAGLGLVGTIVGIAGGSPNVAAGIGYWGVARAVFNRWVARGQKIGFPENTRIVVETKLRPSAPMRANAPSVP